MFRIQKTKRNVVIGMAMLFVVARTVYGDVSLSVTPLEGGGSLRFGQIDTPSSFNKEIRVRVNSNDGQQYEVFQRIIEPLTNDRGEQIDRDVILVSSLAGSNASGSLYLDVPERLSYADQHVFTSSSDGQSDSFTLIYSIDKESINRSGNFSGKIAFTLRPIGSGTQEEAVISVFFEVLGTVDVVAKASSGIDAVRLSSEGSTSRQGSYVVSLEGNLDQEVKVYQEWIEFPADDPGHDIDPQTVLFNCVSDEANCEFTSPSALERQRALVYTSRGGSDNLLINFQLNEETLLAQPAGEFRGRLRYVLESRDWEDSLEVEFAVEIVPVFLLDIRYPEGGMVFDDLMPNTPPQVKEITVKVKSNLGKPYVVTQEVKTPLTNESGEVLAQDALAVQEEVLFGQPGEAEHDQFAAVGQGESTIFTSDKEGSSTEFKVNYRLAPYKGMSAGSFETSIVFSLGEI